MINFKIFTLFAELFPGPLATSITGSALEKGLWHFTTINIRDFAQDARKTVDDIPFGGGAGMVLKPDVINNAITQNVDLKSTKIFYLSPRGKLFNSQMAKELAKEKNIALLCGRYEGVDQRVLDHLQIQEISIGDYVLSGGELAAYVFIDAILRHIPGVLGSAESKIEESFDINNSQYLLEYPQYTRPANWNGMTVPEILTSGHHKNIESWRLEKAIETTKINRSDLYEKYLKNK